MLSQSILIAAVAAALGGALFGALAGSWFTGRRMRLRIEEIGREIVSLRKSAEDKLLDDDPNLPDLLRNLNSSIDQANRAVDALENQSELTKRKTEAAKELVAASRGIVRMIEDMGAELPYDPPTSQRALTAAAPEPVEAEAVEDVAAPTPSPQLR